MKDKYVSGCKVETLVHLVEHSLYNAAGSVKKTIQKIAVFEKVMA